MSGIREQSERRNILQQGYLKALEQLLIPFATVIHNDAISAIISSLLSAVRSEKHRIDREKFEYGSRR